MLNYKLHELLPLHYIFADDVKALTSVWIIGDDFLQRTFHSLQDLKSEAVVKKTRLPYLYENFNISAWFVKQTKSAVNVPTMAKLQNALIVVLNEYPHLPKYIIVIPDKDVIQSNEFYDNGIKKALFDNLQWLSRQFGRNLLARREDLKSKNIGAVHPEITRVIWVRMLARPIVDDPELSKIWKLRRKFNDVMDDLFEVEQYMHVMAINDKEEFQYFDNRGHLTVAGQREFWLSLNQQLKAFEYHNIDLWRSTTTDQEANRNDNRQTKKKHRQHERY